MKQDTKFNGIVYFKLTPKGYVVDDCMRNWFKDRKNNIETVWPDIKCLKIEGTFNFMPRRGQFCKRPHKLIDWSAA